MDDMHDQHETPTSDAARGVGHYITGALAAADLAVRLRTWLTKRLAANEHGDDLQPGDLEQAGKVLDPKREAYTAMLGRDEGRDAEGCRSRHSAATLNGAPGAVVGAGTVPFEARAGFAKRA